MSIDDQGTLEIIKRGYERDCRDAACPNARRRPGLYEWIAPTVTVLKLDEPDSATRDDHRRTPACNRPTR